ncbi:MAG: QueT transporter family protein, partial [Oscillospiraceae bacterium]
MNRANKISKQAMIAAMYTVLCVALSPITYGPVQMRVSEALVLLPIFGAANIWGVSVGCFITNLIGLFTGANILGALDIVLGTFATFLSACLTYYLRNVRFKGLPIASAIPPIIINALVVGYELCIMMSGGFNLSVFALQAFSVA